MKDDIGETMDRRWFKNVQQNPKIDKYRCYVSFVVFISSIGLFSILIVRQFFGRS